MLGQLCHSLLQVSGHLCGRMLDSAVETACALSECAISLEQSGRISLTVLFGAPFEALDHVHFKFVVINLLYNYYKNSPTI